MGSNEVAGSVLTRKAKYRRWHTHTIARQTCPTGTPRITNRPIAIRVAASHDGDSDSTASIAGQIMGAMMGMEGIEDRWVEDLELADVILEVAHDLCVGCQMSECGSFYDEEWMAKYCGSCSGTSWQCGVFASWHTGVRACTLSSAMRINCEQKIRHESGSLVFSDVGPACRCNCAEVQGSPAVCKLFYPCRNGLSSS